MVSDHAAVPTMGSIREMKMLVIAFLFLIACTCANAKSEPSLDDIIDLLKKIDFAALADIHNELKSLTDIVINSLKITEKQKTLLKKKIEKLTDPPLSGVFEDILKKRNVFYYTFQGDIMLTREQGDALIEDVKRLEGGAPLRKPRGVYPDVSYKWPKKMIHYSFHKSASDKVMQVFRNAANAWTKDTCVDIIEDKSGLQESGVIVASAPFCASFLGKAGVPQMIFLNKFCETFRSAAHELGHTLGLLHQEGREDRDDYVKIVTENLEPNLVYMSFKQTRNTNNYSDIGYDFGSIMEAGAKRRRIRCRNGGFQHPRKCEICVCPSGYAGPRCGHKPRGCGEEKNAAKGWQTLTVNFTIGEARKGLDGYKRCTYWIKSPNNTRIEMEIKPTKSPFNDTDLYCNEAGVEVKAIKDQRLTGYKFCSNGDRYNITSPSNLVPIIAFNRDPLLETISIEKSQFIIKYRYRDLTPDEKKSHVYGVLFHCRVFLQNRWDRDICYSYEDVDILRFGTLVE
ncbi:astacin [Necator americanus]|uniref:Metalloendopeptidase n=1 Tax=Necator americanus TaxID=51031 RepID=W2SG80_NECAM|nr:astacin [Necator americanus]ETN68553.1 astacin [Necator americanus]